MAGLLFDRLTAAEIAMLVRSGSVSARDVAEKILAKDPTLSQPVNKPLALLRDRYKYQGELRSIGDVLRDQLFFMQQTLRMRQERFSGIGKRQSRFANEVP